MTLGVCPAQDVTIRYDGAQAKVTQTGSDSVSVTTDGASVSIESLYESHKLTLLLKGKSDDGRLVLKTRGKAKVTLDGLSLTSREGAPLHLKNKKKVELVAAKGTDNTLAVSACTDTANHKAAAVWAKGKLLFSGKGRLNVIATGDGCRGIKSKKDITVEDLTLNVTTSGNNLGEKPFSFPGGFQMPPDSMMHGGFPMPGDSTKHVGFPGAPGGMPPFNPDDIPEDVKKQFQEKMAEGGFPKMPEGGGFPEMPEGGGFGGKHKYVAATKGIASKGKVIINSGTVTVRTSTAGAEGIEGKEGVVFNGGTVDILSPDDAVNAGGCIEFNGAFVLARSTGNDAVDSNPPGGFFPPFGENAQSSDPAIVIRGGTVYAWSQVGSQEEGLDCDFAPIVVEGGKVFTVGGGMGEMPSVPTNDTAAQPTALLIGLDIVKDEPVIICDAAGKQLDTVTVPFDMRRSATLVSCPAFKLGGTYSVRTKGYAKTFTFKENFTICK